MSRPTPAAPSAGVVNGSGFDQNQGISNELYILQNAEDLSESVAQELIERGEGPGG